MESNKQEKYDLLHDNPVVKDASGGRGGSWMSKHATQSKMGSASPLHTEGHGGKEGHGHYKIKKKVVKKPKKKIRV